MNLYPMTFEPFFQKRIWGGRRLGTLFGKKLPPNEPIGESWELSDLPVARSVIANGPLTGQPLWKLLNQFGSEITGKDTALQQFPLLVKLLDTEDVLSVQVHPDAATCQQMGKGHPKSECWYIIAAEPDAVIYIGLKPGTTSKIFAEAVQKGTCAEYLQRVPVYAGQCYFIPAGTPHAIGAGLVIAEIQNPSDTTYRVFDWNRRDIKSGKHRELHIVEAMASIHFDQGELPAPKTAGRLVDTPEYTVDKGHQRQGSEVLLKPGKCRVLVIIKGSGQISPDTKTITTFTAGQTVLVPSAYKGVMQFNTDCEYLDITVLNPTNINS